MNRFQDRLDKLAARMPPRPDLAGQVGARAMERWWADLRGLPLASASLHGAVFQTLVLLELLREQQPDGTPEMNGARLPMPFFERAGDLAPDEFQSIAKAILKAEPFAPVLRSSGGGIIPSVPVPLTLDDVLSVLERWLRVEAEARAELATTSTQGRMNKT